MKASDILKRQHRNFPSIEQSDSVSYNTVSIFFMLSWFLVSFLTLQQWIFIYNDTSPLHDKGSGGKDRNLSLENKGEIHMKNA
ncbi:MAG: hypothetical protein KAX31_04490, partial [Thermoplasmata archaeon]|nr:hypothetical protein [Thermoplasmata archaeon]